MNEDSQNLSSKGSEDCTPDSNKSQGSQSLICGKCGVNRLKERCLKPDDCGFIATAHERVASSLSSSYLDQIEDADALKLFERVNLNSVSGPLDYFVKFDLTKNVPLRYSNKT